MLDCLTSAELAAIAVEPYEARGILHSEMALILHACRRLGVEVVIEAGRARGQSTYLLSKYLPDAHIISIEMRGGPDQAFGEQRCAGLPNVTLCTGDGGVLVPRLVEEVAPHPTAILCDGPPTHVAIPVLKQALQAPHVRAGFLHDLRKLDHGKPSPHRAAALEAFPWAIFSDAQDLVASLAWIDERIIATGGPAGAMHAKEYGSYGPTVGVFINPSVSNGNK